MKNLILVLALVSSSVASARVVWSGDFETGNTSQYSGQESVAADRLLVVSDPVRQGRYALKATVRQGDDPINASGNRNELTHSTYESEGSEYFYRFSVMFPSSYPSANTWQLFAQWHHTGCCGSPPVEFVVNGETMKLQAGPDHKTIWTTKLVRGRWLDFVLHAKWSSDPSVGFMELYVDDALVMPKTMVANMFPGDKNYLKLGLYRNDTIAPEGVVFHDGMTMATTLADVMPAVAEPTPPPSSSTPVNPPPSTSPSPPVATPTPVPLPSGDLGGDVAQVGCSASGAPLMTFAALALVVLLARRRAVTVRQRAGRRS